MENKGRLFGWILIGAAMSLLTACSGVRGSSEPQVYKGGQLYKNQSAVDDNKIFGKDGLNFLGGDKEESSSGPAGIGVNSFLWRASLDTLSFMPLSSADPFGGVIITDWYGPPESPLERFKMTVYILDRRLRADALKVSVFRQTRAAPTAEWRDSSVAKTTPVDLENAILTRARQLRVSSIENAK